MLHHDQDDDVMRCVVCRASVTDNDGGLCDEHKYDEQLEDHMTITLISAAPGDHVGDAIELAELGDRPAWLDQPKVAEFFREVGYGPDNENELIYVLGDGEEAPDGFPRLDVEVTADELDELEAQLAKARERRHEA